MGLLDMLTTQGSPLSSNDGSDPTINPLATKYSSLHYDYKTDTEGWSTRGVQAPDFRKTIQNYLAYNDGTQNFIPEPSALELNEVNVVDPKYRPLYNFQNGGYVSAAKQLI